MFKLPDVMSDKKDSIQEIRLFVTRLFLSSNGIFLLALFSFAFFLAFAFLTGPVESIDTLSYSRWADLLIFVDFNFFAFANELTNLHIPYILFIFTVASLKLGLGEYWIYGLLTLNCLSLSISGYILMRILQETKVGFLELFLVFLVNILLYESFFWSRYLLSDTTFCLISTAFLYSSYCMINRSPRTVISFIFPLGIFFVGFLYRPTAIIFLPLLCLAFLFSYQGKRRVLITQIFFALIIILGLAVLIFWAWYIKRPELWDGSILNQPISRAHHWFHEGAVIKKRLHTYLPVPESAYDILKIELVRLFQFFRFTTPMFSTTHNLVNAVSFLPLYSLALIGIWRTMILLYRDNRPDFIGILSIIFIGSVAVFHSMILIDYDWRYRLPCYPPIFLLAAGGVSFLKQRFQVSNVRGSAGQAT